ncbi:glycosyltransferase [Agarivorans sp. MS3-6]
MENLVSIYMPTCNRLSLLKRAVNSVLQQSHSNFELIVIDDASNDGTKEYLLDLEKLDCRVSFFSNLERKGSQYCRNLALSKAKGVFVTGLDDDDYWKRDRLKIYLNEWGEQYSFLSGGDWFLGRGFFVRNIFKLLKSCFVKYKVYGSERLLSGNVAGNQVFTKTSYLTDIQFDTSMPALQDLDAWFSLARKYGDFKVLNMPTQYIDMSHGYERITKAGNRTQALRLFSTKYGVNKEQLKFLYLENKVGLRENLSFNEQLALLRGGFYSLLLKSMRV